MVAFGRIEVANRIIYMPFSEGEPKEIRRRTEGDRRRKYQPKEFQFEAKEIASRAKEIASQAKPFLIDY